MLQGEHSAILLTFIELPFVIKIFVLSILSGRFTQVLLKGHKLEFQNQYVISYGSIITHKHWKKCTGHGILTYRLKWWKNIVTNP